MIKLDIHSERAIKLKGNIISDILYELWTGRRSLTIGPQLHSTDGFYKDAPSKTNIWFVYHPSLNTVVCKNFRIGGVTFSVENLVITEPLTLPESNMLKAIHILYNQVNATTEKN